MMKKKIIIPVLLAAIFVLPFVVSAATFGQGERYTLSKGDTISDNLYIGAGEANLSGDINGDAMIAGGNILITGNVEGDLHIAGGSITVLGNVGDDLISCGGTIVIGGNIGGDIVVCGGTVNILSGAVVGGDIVGAGGQILLDGIVNGGFYVAGGEVYITGSVIGDVDAGKVEKLTVGDNAIIGGNITHRKGGADISASASIGGEIIEKGITKTSTKGKKVAFLSGLIGVALVVKVFMSLVTAIILVLLFKKFSKNVGENVLSHFWKNFLVGLIVLIVVPVAAILLFVTVLGVPLGLIILLAYVLLIALAKPYAGIILGAFLAKTLKGRVIVDWKWAALGVVVFLLICMVPFVGWIVCFALILASLGTIAHLAYQKLWLDR